MFDSLRARLLVWFTTILAIALVGFGSLVCYAAWRTRLADVDATLVARAEALLAAVHPVAGGTFDLALTSASADPADVAIYHIIWSAAGDTIDRADLALEPETAAVLEARRPPSPGVVTVDGRRELTRRAPGGATVLVGRDLDDARAEIWRLAGSMAAIGLAAMALAAAGGWWLAAGALAPIDRISRTARAMVEGDFHARVPIDRVETELGQLARALNEAFDRLHASLERQQRFTADASHELRTPLTTLSTELQWALARSRTPDEYRQSLETGRRAVERMQAVVERLLSLARAGADVDRDRHGDVPLDAVVNDVVRDLQPLAARKRVTLATSVVPAVVRGERDRLREAIENVVTNAIQYNVEDGRVDVELKRDGDSVTVAVTDTGIGIAPEHLSRIFVPFFRADPARSREAGGAGLGLAIADTIVRRLGGTTSCSSELGRGTRIQIELPGV
jgi:heavy metal sensor kinase